LFIPKCVSSASRICLPTVSTGLRDVIGSWKIIAISRPRIRRSPRSERFSRSVPSKTAVPAVTEPARGRMAGSAGEGALLPQPDSPTIPSGSPGEIANEIPLTAWTVPRRVWNSTFSPSTLRRGSDAATKLRVEGLAQRVADEVEAEGGDDDRDSRDDREP